MFTITPIATVSNSRLTPEDNYWGKAIEIRQPDWATDLMQNYWKVK